ncbi:unnamed protein product [Lota lota]
MELLENYQVTVEMLGTSKPEVPRAKYVDSRPRRELGERDSLASQAPPGFPPRRWSVNNQDFCRCYICVQDGRISCGCPTRDVSMTSAGSSYSPTQPQPSLTTYAKDNYIAQTQRATGVKQLPTSLTHSARVCLETQAQNPLNQR